MRVLGLLSSRKAEPVAGGVREVLRTGRGCQWMSVSSAQEVVQIFLSSSGDRSRGGGGGCEKNTGSPVVLDEPFIRRLSANAMAGVMSCS